MNEFITTRFEHYQQLLIQSPAIAHAPDHIHQADETVVGNPHLPTLETVLAEIESSLA